MDEMQVMKKEVVDVWTDSSDEESNVIIVETSSNQQNRDPASPLPRKIDANTSPMGEQSKVRPALPRKKLEASRQRKEVSRLQAHFAEARFLFAISMPLLRTLS